VSCEIYEKLVAGPLTRLLIEKGDRFFKVVKLVASAVPLVSSLAEIAELLADLYRPGLMEEFVKLVKAARDVGQCNEEVKRAAGRLGVDEERLKTIVQNLAALSEIEFGRLEKRLSQLEKGYDLLMRLSRHILLFGQLFVEEGGRLFVKSPFGIVMEYVEVGVEGRVREALSRGRVVVVYGPRGVGKSITVLKAVYDFAKDQQDKEVVVVRVGKKWDEAIDVATQLQGGPFVPVLYYDTLEARGYRRSGEGVDVAYHLMVPLEPLAKFLHDAVLLRVPTVVVLAEEDYRAYEDVLIGVEAVRLGGGAEILVRGILRGVPPAVEEAVLEKYKGEFYAVAAALAKALYEDWRDPAKVAEAVKRLDVYSLALVYLWHVVLGGDEAVARQVAPLILATGLFGPHPPKLAKAVVEAFGREPDSRVVRWFSQSLHRTVFEAIKNFVKCVHQSKDGDGDIALCKDNVTQSLIQPIPRELAENGEKIAEVLKQKVIEATDRLSSLVGDFTWAVKGRKLELLTQEGRRLYRWALKSRTLGIVDVFVEDIYDQLDVLLAVLGVASQRATPSPLEEFAKEWILIGGEPAQALSEYVRAALYANRDALRNKVAELFYRVRNRGYLTRIDLWEVMGLLKAVDWENAGDEEVKYAIRLIHYLLREYKNDPPETDDASLPEHLFKAALSRLDKVAGDLAFLFRRYTVYELDPWTLYGRVNNLEKVFILQGLLRQRAKDRNDLDKVAKIVEELEKELKDYDITLLLYLTVYPRLAVHYAEVGEREKAEACIDKSLRALKRVSPSIEKLRQLLSPYYSPLEFERWAAELPLYVYINAALAYMSLGDVQRGLEMVKKAWKLISALVSNEHVVVKALEAYLVALAYRGDKKFDEVVDKYSEIVGHISDTTYNVLKRLGANIQKIYKIRQREIDTPPGSGDLQMTKASKVEQLAFVRFSYNALLKRLLYV